MITRTAVFAQCTRALDPVLSPAYARREEDRAHRRFLAGLRASVRQLQGEQGETAYGETDQHSARGGATT